MFYVTIKGPLGQACSTYFKAASKSPSSILKIYLNSLSIETEALKSALRKRKPFQKSIFFYPFLLCPLGQRVIQNAQKKSLPPACVPEVGFIHIIRHFGNPAAGLFY